jgi:hypothetical protein
MAEVEEVEVELLDSLLDLFLYADLLREMTVRRIMLKTDCSWGRVV